MLIRSLIMLKGSNKGVIFPQHFSCYLEKQRGISLKSYIQVTTTILCMCVLLN